MAHERKCIVDRADYKYCSNCNSYNKYETWRYLFCSENCRAIYYIAEDFLAEKLSAQEAYEKLQKYDLTKLDHFTADVKRNVETILETGKPVEVVAEEYTKIDEESFTIDIPEVTASVTPAIVEEVPEVSYKKKRRKPTTTENDE